MPLGSSAKHLRSDPPSRSRLRLSTTGSLCQIGFSPRPLALFPVSLCYVIVLGAGSCGYTVPRSAWLLRRVSANLPRKPSVRSDPRSAWLLRSFGFVLAVA